MKSTREELISIPKWKLDTIENALRLTNNIYHCYTQETAYDREVTKAYTYAKDFLKSYSKEEEERSCSTCYYVNGFRCKHPQGCESDSDYELWQPKDFKPKD